MRSSCFKTESYRAFCRKKYKTWKRERKQCARYFSWRTSRILQPDTLRGEGWINPLKLPPFGQECRSEVLKWKRRVRHKQKNWIEFRFSYNMTTSVRNQTMGTLKLPNNNACYNVSIFSIGKWPATLASSIQRAGRFYFVICHEVDPPLSLPVFRWSKAFKTDGKGRQAPPLEKCHSFPLFRFSHSYYFGRASDVKTIPVGAFQDHLADWKNKVNNFYSGAKPVSVVQKAAPRAWVRQS